MYSCETVIGGRNVCCPAEGIPPKLITAFEYLVKFLVRSDVCPMYSHPFIDPTTNKLQLCYENNIDCPESFVCYFSEKLRHYICCSHQEEAHGSSKAMNRNLIGFPGLASMLAILIATIVFCTCSYCVTEMRSHGCPKDHNAYLDRQSGVPVRCSPYIVNGCPAGYHCLYSPEFTHYQCCAESGLNKCIVFSALIYGLF